MLRFLTPLRRIIRALTKIRAPLLIGGIAMLFLFFAFHYVLTNTTFAPLQEEATVTILQAILDYVFYLAMAVTMASLFAYTAPRILPKSLFEPIPTVKYGLSIVQLFNPADTGIGQVLARVEPYPGFPYYSRESDHPSYWPPRVGKDRGTLYRAYRDFYCSPAIQQKIQAARAHSGDESSVEILHSAPAFADDEQSRVDETIANGRMFLRSEANASGHRLVEILGEDDAAHFLDIERERHRMAARMPNRLAIIRARNTSRDTLKNLEFELELHGALYDYLVTSDENDEQRAVWDARRNRIRIDDIPPNYTVEIKVWYHYQSVDEKVFPDKIDLIHEIHQGLVIANASVDDGRVVFDQHLVSEIPAYEVLYSGNGLKRDNYDRELRAYLEKKDAELAEAMANRARTHPTLEDVEPDRLPTCGVDEHQVDNVWLAFRSPAGLHYKAVHVYEHPNGPYVLLVGDDKDHEDFSRVHSRISAYYDSPSECEITDRGSDICASIRVEQGFSLDAIADFAAAIASEGYSDVVASKVHYHVNSENADA